MTSRRSLSASHTQTHTHTCKGDDCLDLQCAKCRQKPRAQSWDIKRHHKQT